MIVVADTNVLLRAFVQDDPRQSKIAQQELKDADRIIIPTVALCEFAWTLGRGYKFTGDQIASMIRSLGERAHVSMDSNAITEGLAMLDAGGDFADGVIAFEGFSEGAESFISFDRRAVTILQRQGKEARFLSQLV